MFISKLSTELKRGTPLILSWKKYVRVFTFGNNRECQLRILETDASVGGVDDFNSECTTSVLIG